MMDFSKISKFVRGRRGNMSRLRREFELRPAGPLTWIHSASYGEFEEVRPVVERIRERCPEGKILLTFFSPSGYEVRKNYSGADIVCYLPFDTPGNVLSFFRLIKPEMAFFIKYEFWFNFLIACRHQHIPVYSVSSIFRSNKIFFRWDGIG